MAAIEAKKYTIDSLLQFQKCLNDKLRAKISTQTSKINELTSICLQKNSWQKVDDLISQAQQSLNSLKSMPTKYANSQQQHEIQKLKIEIDRNKIKKMKLQAQRKKLVELNQIQQKKLQILLTQLSEIENKVKEAVIDPKQMQNYQIASQQKEIQLPQLEQLLQNYPIQIRQKFLANNLKEKKQFLAIQFFNSLARRVLQTDRQISFLITKKNKQQNQVQFLQKQHKKLQKEAVGVVDRKKMTQKNIRDLKLQQKHLEQELQCLYQHDYVKQQLRHRVENQISIDLQQCKKMKIALKKMIKLIELSEDTTAIEQMKTITRQIQV